MSSGPCCGANAASEGFSKPVATRRGNVVLTAFGHSGGGWTLDVSSLISDLLSVSFMVTWIYLRFALK